MFCHFWHYILATNIEGATTSSPVCKITNLEFIFQRCPDFYETLLCRTFKIEFLPLFMLTKLIQLSGLLLLTV